MAVDLLPKAGRRTLRRKVSGTQHQGLPRSWGSLGSATGRHRASVLSTRTGLRFRSRRCAARSWCSRFSTTAAAPSVPWSKRSFAAPPPTSEGMRGKSTSSGSTLTPRSAVQRTCSPTRPPTASFRSRLWFFLTGSSAELSATWRKYDITVEEGSRGTVAYTAAIYFVTPAGDEAYEVTPYANELANGTGALSESGIRRWAQGIAEYAAKLISVGHAK